MLMAGEVINLVNIIRSAKCGKKPPISRVYAGIHYRFTQMLSIDMGIELGNEIDKVRVVGPEYK